MKFVCKIAKIDRGSLCDFTVAPHAGAWVEMDAHTLVPGLGKESPPHAGAWVEIVWRETGPSTRRRRPPTRGLCCTPKCGTLDKKKYQQ